MADSGHGARSGCSLAKISPWAKLPGANKPADERALAVACYFLRSEHEPEGMKQVIDAILAG